MAVPAADPAGMPTSSTATATDTVPATAAVTGHAEGIASHGTLDVAPANALGRWTLHCDGSAVPNPGRMGLGAVLVAPDGERHTVSYLAPGTGCNNEAELRAVSAALDAARAHGATAVRLHTDSTTVVAHLGPAAPSPIPHLAEAFAEARTRLAAFADAELRWIPGHRNGEADALARAALGLPPRTVAAPRKRRR